MIVFNSFKCKSILMKIIIIIFILMSFVLCPENVTNKGLTENDLFEFYWNGILETESNNMHYRNWKIVKSHKGAVGIAQVKPTTFNDIIRWSKRKDLKSNDVYHPKHNEWAGRFYFSNAFFYVYRSDVVKAVSSYNMGTNSKRINYNYVGKVFLNGSYD